MSSMLPSISPELARIAPGFRALSINVIAAPVRDAQVGEIALKEACQTPACVGTGAYRRLECGV